MARSVSLELTMQTSSTANPKAALATITLEDEYTYTSQVLDIGDVPAGAGWFSVNFGDITTAQLTCLSLATAATVRLNGSEELPSTSYLQLKGEITSLEVAKGAEANEYSVQIFA